METLLCKVLNVFIFKVSYRQVLICIGYLKVGLYGAFVINNHNYSNQSFPGNSASKESACNAGDPGSIPRAGRSPGEVIDYPLQYYWASLAAQLVKNSSIVWETWVWSLGWEDLLEKGTATHFSILAQRISWTVQSMRLQRIRHA